MKDMSLLMDVLNRMYEEAEIVEGSLRRSLIAVRGLEGRLAALRRVLDEPEPPPEPPPPSPAVREWGPDGRCGGNAIVPPLAPLARADY